MMPNAPRSSSTCFAGHCAFSLPFGGIRTIGVIAGATVSASKICFRFSRYWKLSLSAAISHGLCSVSNTRAS